jgi:DNA-binding transcriptional regulator YiaG
MKLIAIAMLISVSIAIQAAIAFTANPLLRPLILPLPMVLLAIGVGLWVYRPITPRERYRKRKRDHVRQMRRILRTRPKNYDLPVVTVVEGFLPKNLERGSDGAWRTKDETDYVLGEEGNWLIDPKKSEKSSPIQVWEDFRVEVRQMIVEEVQAIMATGWPFDSQLAKVSPYDMLMAKRISEQRVALKISQAVLGKMLGVSTKTISDWEHARKPVPTIMVHRVKRHLKIEQY